MRFGFALALLIASNSATSAQMQGMKQDPDKKIQQAGPVPAGWALRLDRTDAKQEDLNFTPMGKGMHMTTGPAAIFWNPANTAAGTFSVSATFSQEEAPTHPEAYGLIWAGKNLAGDDEAYLYYIVRGDGKFMVKRRTSVKDLTNVTEWSDSPVLNKQDATTGRATNALEVRVGTDSVRLFANGKPVKSYDRKVMAENAGIYGVRVNHNLDVHVEGFAKK